MPFQAVFVRMWGRAVRYDMALAAEIPPVSRKAEFMKKLLLVIFFTIVPILAHGGTYYVAKTGSDNNSLIGKPLV